MSKIHLVDGEKGGVGKSFFAKTLIEYCLAQKIPYTLIDADQTNADVYRLYPEGAYKALFSDLDKNFHRTDVIFESALKNPVILNLPAQIANLINAWVERSNILEVGAENGVEICKWFVCSGGYDSVNLFKESIAYYGAKITHVFVKNMALTDDWAFLEEEEDFHNLLRQYPETIKTIEFAKCNYKERYDLERLQMTLSAALSSDEFGILAKQRLLNFQKASFTAISSSGLIEKPVEESREKGEGIRDKETLPQSLTDKPPLIITVANAPKVDNSKNSNKSHKKSNSKKSSPQPTQVAAQKAQTVPAVSTSEKEDDF